MKSHVSDSLTESLIGNPLEHRLLLRFCVVSVCEHVCLFHFISHILVEVSSRSNLYYYSLITRSATPIAPFVVIDPDIRKESRLLPILLHIYLFLYSHVVNKKNAKVSVEYLIPYFDSYFALTTFQLSSLPAQPK